MESEKSTKRAILAAAACEGIYLAIGIAVQIIIGIIAAILISVSNSGGSVTGAATLVFVIIPVVATAIAYWEYKLAMRLIPKIAMNTQTEILGFRILGWMLIGLNVIDFFLSVSGQYSASMAGIVIGILFLRNARKMDKMYISSMKEQGIYIEPAAPTPPVLPPQYSLDNDK